MASLSYLLAIHADCSDAVQGRQLAEYLSSCGRPDFPEDLDAASRHIYDAICDCDFPHEVSVEGTLLCATWCESDLRLKDVDGMLKEAGATIRVAFEILDEESGKGSYYARLDRRLIRISASFFAERYPEEPIPRLRRTPEAHEKDLRALYDWVSERKVAK